jgi:short-subunit dehydrogenase
MKAAIFHEKVAIITGASSGIGRAVALELAEQGARLTLAARDQTRLAQVADDCRNLGGQALPVATDVADENQVRALVEGTVDHFRRLDLLVNNAGIGLGGSLDELADLRLFERVMQVNFMGAVYSSFYALPYLKSTSGWIVNVSSLGGRFPLPRNTAYIASKHALQGFSDSLRMELAGSGVSVTVVSPYWVVTEFHERLMDKTGNPVGSKGRGLYTDRMMTAEKCARIIVSAAVQRKREVLLWPGPVALWLKLIAPGIMDKLIQGAIFKPAIKRVKEQQNQ